MNYSVRKLDEEHYLEFFETTTSSGKGAKLGEWLQTKAREYQKLHRSVVWVMGDADDPGDVIGYFTLNGYQITGESLTRRLRSGIDLSQTHPAHLLGKFALRTDDQGKGMGELLMLEVFRKYRDVASISGSRFLCLHVRNKELEKYYDERYGFSTVSDGDGYPKLMVISTEAVLDLLRRVEESGKESYPS